MPLHPALHPPTPCPPPTHLKDVHLPPTLHSPPHTHPAPPAAHTPPTLRTLTSTGSSTGFSDATSLSCFLLVRATQQAHKHEMSHLLACSQPATLVCHHSLLSVALPTEGLIHYTGTAAALYRTWLEADLVHQQHSTANQQSVMHGHIVLWISSHAWPHVLARP